MAPEATWRPGAPEPGGLYQKIQKMQVGNIKSQLLSVITYPLTIKINSVITVAANVSDLPPPLDTFPLIKLLSLTKIFPLSCCKCT